MGQGAAGRKPDNSRLYDPGGEGGANNALRWEIYWRLHDSAGTKGEVFGFQADRDSFHNDSYCIELPKGAGSEQKINCAPGEVEFGTFFGKDDTHRLAVYLPPPGEARWRRRSHAV